MRYNELVTETRIGVDCLGRRLLHQYVVMVEDQRRDTKGSQ